MVDYWKDIRQIIKESDVVVVVLDARLVDVSRNSEIERIIAELGKPMIYALNKSDLVTKEILEISVDKLHDETHLPVVYTSKNKKNTIRNLITWIKRVFNEGGKAEREEFDKFTPKVERKHRVAKGEIVVGILGYPNVGKSSLINSMTFKKKAKVSSKAGTTHGLQWLSSNYGVKFIDSPGVIPLRHMDEGKLGLIASKNPEKLKEPDLVAMKIIEMFISLNKKALEKFYNFEINEELNSVEILDEISKAKAHLKKGAEPDTSRTSIMIVRDWQTGKLKL
jgi:ribosome biogenesis GTPase A